MKKYLIFSFILCFLSCGNAQKNNNSSATKGANTSSDGIFKYASGISVRDTNGTRLVDITDPSGSTSLHYKYALVHKDSSAVNVPEDYAIIRTPISKVICMTSLQLSGFIKLGVTDKIAGITSTRFLKNAQLRSRLEDGSLHRIGIEGDFDAEVVLSIDPDLILISPFKRGGYGAIEDLDIPLLAYMGYKESDPLGQTEWIKFVGMLCGKEAEADSLFSEIEERYLKLKALTADISKRPKILSGELHSGNWYVVGGESYLANIFYDAGAQYFMTNNKESGGFYVDYETVYSQGAETDFWRVTNNFNGKFSYEALLASDSRYADFKPFRDKKVVYCSLREKPFYENTPMEPEVVLADLIHIFHPELLTDHQPVYYELLK